MNFKQLIIASSLFGSFLSFSSAFASNINWGSNLFNEKIRNNNFTQMNCGLVTDVIEDNGINSLAFRIAFNTYSIRVDNNERVHDFSNYMIERRTWHGHAGGWKGRDRSMDNAALTVVVKRGCVLTLYEHPYLRGDRIQYKNSHNSDSDKKMFRIDIDQWSNKASSAHCACGTGSGNQENDPNISLPFSASAGKRIRISF